MSAIEKFVSPFIPQQFPAFYKEEGPNFIAFVKAYYEWMESTNQALQRSRSLLKYADIDTTEQEFLKYFRNTYLHSLPESIIADKRLLVKHILDLYRAKGTPRAYELLFRLIFNEDIELYIPSEFILKPSDGEWTVPRYIEVSDSDYLEDLIGKQIYNSSRNATAVVESVNQKVVNKRLFHVLTLSSIKGRFKFGEKILSASVPEITLANAPSVLGSLTAITIDNGGRDFNVGDVVYVTGAGVDAKARIAAVRDENGKVNFVLENGGSGYSLDGTVITVDTALNLIIENSTGTFSNGNIITSSNTSANGTLVSSNSSLLKLIDFSSNLIFNPGDTVTNGSGASATVIRTTGGVGSGATFAVGGLVNKEVLSINTDFISNYLSANLDSVWVFSKNPVANLSSTIEETLTFVDKEVGSISFLDRINPGTNYSASPFVTIVEPVVAAQAYQDGFGGTKGLNARVLGAVANSTGIATAVQVINSGFGYNPGEKVFLSNPNDASIIATGKSVINTDGVGEGYWKNNKGFVSDIMNIQDSYYYQDFSYEILVNRMLSVYEKIVKDLIHPSGVALFGRFRLKNQMLGVASEPEFFGLQSAAAVPPALTDLITLTDYNTLTLDRNFAANYIRSTDGNLVGVGANVARFDPVQGLLIEKQATNLFWPSRDLTDARWRKVNATVALTATGAEGTSNAATIVTASAADAWVAQYGATSTAGSHGISIMARRRTGTGDVRFSQGQTTGGDAVGPALFYDPFDSAAGWTLTTGWSITGGKLVGISVNTDSPITKSLPSTMVAGLAYAITYTIDSISSGSIQPRFGGGAAVVGGVRSTAGTFTDVIRINADAGYLQFGIFPTTNGTNVNIDNITIQPYLQPPTALTSQWQRFDLGVDTTTASRPNPAVSIYLATSGDEIDVDFAQGEVGSVSTSPIITTSGTVTRLTDQLSTPISALDIPTSGLCTMVGTFNLSQLGSGGYLPNLMEINNGSLNDRAWVYNSGGTLVLARSTGGATTSISLIGTVVANTQFRVAMSHAGNGRVAASLNGSAVQTLTGAPTSYTTMRVGSGFGGDQPMFGYERGFSYSNTAVSDTRLQQLSALS